MRVWKGVKVMMKKRDLKGDEIGMKGVSMGGR